MRCTVLLNNNINIDYSFILQVDRENRWFGVIPRIYFADKETYVESETKQYDMVKYITLTFKVNGKNEGISTFTED